MWQLGGSTSPGRRFYLPSWRFYLARTEVLPPKLEVLPSRGFCLARTEVLPTKLEFLLRQDRGSTSQVGDSTLQVGVKHASSPPGACQTQAKNVEFQEPGIL